MNAIADFPVWAAVLVGLFVLTGALLTLVGSRTRNLREPAFGYGRRRGTWRHLGDAYDDAACETGDATDPVLRLRTDPVVRRLADDLVPAARYDPGTPAAMLAALRAVALAAGDGVPSGAIWADLTAAVAGTDVPDVERLLDLLLSGPLAGHLGLSRAGDDQVYALTDPALTHLLAARPEVLWAAVQERAGTDVRPLPPGDLVLDPPDAVHARIARALVAAMVRDGVIDADPPPAVPVARRGDEHLHWTRWEAGSSRISASDRSAAAWRLERLGHTTEAAGTFTAIAGDTGGELDDRYRAAADLWRIGQRAAALDAYRLLLREPRADRAAMQRAVDAINAGAEPPPSYNTPGIPIGPPPMGGLSMGPTGPLP